MARPALVLLATAALLAGADLAHKAAVTGEATLLHERGTAYVVLAVVAVPWAGALVAARSLALAVAGGVLLGGAAGNLASLALWPGVPDPLVAGPVAFNLADVFALAGGLVLVPAAAAFVLVRRRGRLREPIAFR